MNEDERKAKDAARKREAYRRRKEAQAVSNSLPKKDEELANPASIPPGVLYQENHKDNAQAILAEAEERGRRLELIMSMYKKDAANANNLLWHILETLTLLRLEIVDLIGGLSNGK